MPNLGFLRKLPIRKDEDEAESDNWSEDDYKTELRAFEQHLMNTTTTASAQDEEDDDEDEEVDEEDDETNEYPDDGDDEDSDDDQENGPASSLEGRGPRGLPGPLINTQKCGRCPPE